MKPSYAQVVLCRQVCECEAVLFLLREALGCSLNQPIFENGGEEALPADMQNVSLCCI